MSNMSRQRSSPTPTTTSSSSHNFDPLYVQQVIAERDALRKQNDHLWQIIEKQRLIVQQLQKKNAELHKEWMVAKALRKGTSRDDLSSRVEKLKSDEGDELTDQQLTHRRRSKSVDSLTMLSKQMPTVAESKTEGALAKSDAPSDLMASVQAVETTIAAQRSNGDNRPHTSEGRRLSTISVPTTVFTRIDSVAEKLAQTVEEDHEYNNRYSVVSVETVDEEIAKEFAIQHEESAVVPEPFMTLHTTENVTTSILQSSIQPDDRGREIAVFTISVRRRPNLQAPDAELHKIEKTYFDVVQLEVGLRGLHGKSVVARAGKLPEKSLFTKHAPHVLDVRRQELDRYLKGMCEAIPKDSTLLCEFLSTDVVKEESSSGSNGFKEGYLIKRGKNFGGWKTRYFIIKSSQLEYYEYACAPSINSIAVERWAHPRCDSNQQVQGGQAATKRK
jgi:hypothetical protein